MKELREEIDRSRKVENGYEEPKDADIYNDTQKERIRKSKRMLKFLKNCLGSSDNGIPI